MGARLQDLNDRLADALVDPVDVYSDNGLSYDSSRRDQLLNSASRYLYNVFIETYRLILRQSKGRTKVDISTGIDYLSDFIAPIAVATTSQAGFPEDGATSYSVPVTSIHQRLKAIFFVVGSQATPLVYEYIEKQDVLKVFSGISRYKASAYAPKCWISTISAVDYLRITPSESTTLRITYLRYPNYSLLASDSEDWEWRKEFDDTIIKLATAFAFLYNGEPDKFMAIVTNCLSAYQIEPQFIRQSVQIEEQTKASP